MFKLWLHALAFVFILPLLGCSRLGDLPGRTGKPSPPTIVPCANIKTLRDLSGFVQMSTNPRTGHALDYLVVGDGVASNQVLVFFNGTSQIIPDWPVQMLTNRARSPRIASTPAFTPAEDGVASLCRDERLVFFDYPGVGLSTDAANYTEPQVADDVDAMLDMIGRKYGISTSDVSLVGWSLGTLMALKYATLAPAATASRTIHDIILIATKPGGGQSAQTDGNGAQCVQQTFNALKDPTPSRILRIKLTSINFNLLFPYKGQTPYDGPNEKCEISIDASHDGATLNVTPAPCGPGTPCFKIAAEWAADRLTRPWSKTQGVPGDVYSLQRDFNTDWNGSYCPSAGPGFMPLNCTSMQPVTQSALNGGVCMTQTPASSPNAPVATNCAPLQISGTVTVINAPEDLYIQHTYGAALVRGYQEEYGASKANLVTYDGADGGGHGILLEHPGWVQLQIARALQPAAKP